MGIGGKKVEMETIDGRQYQKGTKQYNEAIIRRNQRDMDRERQRQKDAELQKLIDTRPQYRSIQDTDQYKTLLGQAYSTEDLPQFALLKQQAQQAAAEGNTKLAQQLNDELQNQAIAGSGALQNAYSGLAMGGGLSGGARERIAASGAEQQLGQAQSARLSKMRGEQDIQNKLSQGLLDLGAKSAESKLGMQQRLLGTQQQDIMGRSNLEQAQHAQSMEIAAARAKGLAEEQAAYEAQRRKKEEKKIICTKLNEMGMLDDDVFAVDQEFGKWCLRNHPDVMFGYLAWATYILRLIEWMPFVAYIIAPPVRAWANQMAYVYNGKGKRSAIGWLIMTTGWQFSKALGFIVYTKRRRKTV